MAPENLVMVYSPRDEQEANVIYDLLQAAYRYAGAACLNTQKEISQVKKDNTDAYQGFPEGT